MSPSSPSPPSLPVSASQAAVGAAGASPQSVDLTNWFLDAKRSLASVALCARANSLVDSARGALQEAAIISSKCLFLRNALQDQLLVAIRVNRMMHSVREASKSDFEVCPTFFLFLCSFLLSAIYGGAVVRPRLAVQESLVLLSSIFRPRLQGLNGVISCLGWGMMVCMAIAHLHCG